MCFRPSAMSVAQHASREFESRSLKHLIDASQPQKERQAFDEQRLHVVDSRMRFGREAATEMWFRRYTAKTDMLQRAEYQ